MKKTKPSKKTIPLLMLLLLSTLPLTYLPIPVAANPAEIEMLTFFAEPHEKLYWDQVIPKFQAEYPGITIKHTAIEFDALFDEIIRLHLLGQDPDIISVHGMWLPRFAVEYAAGKLVDPILTENVPSDIKADVANFYIPAVEGSTYKGVIYGYPTEIDSHALVYDRALLGSYSPPTNWDELRTVARAVTTRQAGAIYVSGFMPYINGNEEKRYEFMNLLWSNKGEFLDLMGELPGGTYGVPQAVFNSVEGVQALQLFESLNDNKVANPADASYDPDILPDIYWSGWAEHRIAMVVIPTWFNYIRDAIGEPYFSDNIRVVPVPIGPSMVAAGGTYPQNSTCVTFNHLFGVSQRAENEGRAGEAWTFLRWINQPRPYNYIPTSAVGPIPRKPVNPPHGPVSILGDYFIYDGIMPSRKTDIAFGSTRDGKHLSEDVWFSGFSNTLANNGRADPVLLKAQEVQDKVGVMFERVASYGEDPKTVADETADAVNDILPVPGDANNDGIVYPGDFRFVLLDWNAHPGEPKWHRGRADVVEDNWVSAKDGILIIYNWGARGDP